MAHANFIRALREFGVVETARKLHQLKTLKFGSLVGVDRFNNRYYENTEDYPYGHHRWIEYDGYRSFYSVDPSEVPPEWFSWLHGTTDTPPSSNTIGTVAKMAPLPTVSHTDAPYARNHGGVVAEPRPNQTQARPRGFGINNGLPDAHGIATGPSEERFWTQPGWPLDPRHKHPRRDVGYSLKDTAADVRQRRLAAAESGSAGALAESHMARLAEGGDAELPTFALPPKSEESEAAVEADSEEFAAGAEARDVVRLEGHVERLQTAIRRYEALAHLEGDIAASLDEAREQLDFAQKMLAAARAASSD